MKSKSHISARTKKILLTTGIAFGTIMVFIVSFFLAFSLIVNPINFVTLGGEEMAEENEELKTQVQTLEDEIELLNTTVEKYKSSAATNVIVQTQTQTAPSTSSQQTSTPDVQPEAETETEAEPETESEIEESGSEFSPETVTTPEEGIEPEVELDITVIDISE